MNFKAITITALSVAGLAACGPKGAQEAQKIETKAQLAGKWQRCEATSGPTDVLLGFKSVAVSYVFIGPVSESRTYYKDADCKNEAVSVTYTGQVTIGANTGGTPGTDSADSNLMDFNFTKVVAKVSDEATAKALNSAIVPSCSINDWQVGKEVDLTEKTRGGSNTCFIPAPAPVYDIAKTDGKTLHLGKGLAAEKNTQEKRPKALDMEKGFEKK